jgi:two-component system cell cycle response regulator CtrA
MDEPELKILDVFMCKLRKKLAHASNGRNYIETVWGRGYVLREPDVDTGLPGFLVLDARASVERCKPK